MPFKPIADESFTADYLNDAFGGVMSYLEDNNVPDDNDGPETIIVIRNNVKESNGKRTFTGSVYVGKSIDEIKNDLK